MYICMCVSGSEWESEGDGRLRRKELGWKESGEWRGR